MKIWFAFDNALKNTWSFFRQDDEGNITTIDTGVDVLRQFYWKVTAGIVTMVYGKTSQKFEADVPDTADDIYVKAPADTEAWQTPEWGKVRTRYAKSADPNDVQVGGEHYKGVDFQPWDWARNVSGTQGLGYYEVSAISYIARFRKKGGIEDLEKVLHYIDKMLHCWRAGEYSNRCTATLLRIRDFNRQNGCDRFQSEAIHFLVAWREGDELVEVKKIVEELIQQERDDDFNHHHEASTYARVPVYVPPAPIEVPDVPAMLTAALGSVQLEGSGTGSVKPREEPAPPPVVAEPPPPPFDLATAVLPPYKPLKPALKIPAAWNEDSINGKFIDD